MNNWQLFKTILHSIDFYWKKFIVLSIFVIAIIAGVHFWRISNTTEASFSFSDVPQYQTIPQKNVNIVVQSNGKVLVDGKENSRALKIFSDYDEIRLLVVDNPGVFIGKLQVVISLPQAVQKDQVEQITYAVHGVGSYRNYISDNNKTLVYEASDISSQATLTIVAHLPKNIINPPFAKQITYYLSTISAQSYLILAIILPLFTLIITLFMVYKRRKDQIISLNVAPSNKLPSQIAPAVVGVLLDGQVSAREMAATLIDLASRGYIFITRKGRNFSFGKRKSLNIETCLPVGKDSPELKDFEKMLLAKIFMPQSYRSTREDVEMRVGHHIFSRKIAQVFAGIYDEATRSGYFIKNPAIVHQRWRYAGIILFFLGILGFAQSAFYAPDPKFTLLFWVGELAAAAVIIKISGLMPARSTKGSQALGSWMAFRKYLKLNRSIEPGANYQGLFEKYLPYAIVFGVEVEWAKRFFNERFTKPNWYESIENTTTLEEFVGGLFPLISFVGEILAKSHEPTVE